MEELLGDFHVGKKHATFLGFAVGTVAICGNMVGFHGFSLGFLFGGFCKGFLFGGFWFPWCKGLCMCLLLKKLDNIALLEHVGSLSLGVCRFHLALLSWTKCDLMLFPHNILTHKEDENNQDSWSCQVNGTHSPPKNYCPDKWPKVEPWIPESLNSPPKNQPKLLYLKTWGGKKKTI